MCRWLRSRRQRIALHTCGSAAKLIEDATENAKFDALHAIDTTGDTLALKLACTSQFEPGLEVLGYDLEEQRTLGVARVVGFGLAC